MKKVVWFTVCFLLLFVALLVITGELRLAPSPITPLEPAIVRIYFLWRY